MPGLMLGVVSAAWAQVRSLDEPPAPLGLQHHLQLGERLAVPLPPLVVQDGTILPVRFLVFVFGNVVSSSRCHVYSLVYIVFSDIDVTGVLILCKGLFFNPFGLPFLDSMMHSYPKN